MAGATAAPAGTGVTPDGDVPTSRDGDAGSIGFLLHPREVSSAPVHAALETATRLGFRTWTVREDAERRLAENIDGCRLLITVGGDGTFLLGARVAAARGVPLLGVNRGQLGFLTDIDLAALPGGIAAWAQGHHRLLRRSLLDLLVPGDAEAPLLATLALNEVAVKSTGSNLTRIRVEADGELMGDFDADGIIVATATGSTAYALSAGGPPVDPRVRAIVVVPLAPHAVLQRAVVLPEAVTLHVTVVRGRTIAYADGHVDVALREGTRLVVRPGPELRTVHLSGAPGFLTRLRETMRMGLPLKQSEDPHGEVG